MTRAESAEGWETNVGYIALPTGPRSDVTTWAIGQFYITNKKRYVCESAN